MAGKGGTAAKRARRGRIRLLIAGIVILNVAAPAGSNALELQDTVCDLRQALSLLLKPCPEEPAPPPAQQPKSSTSPKTAPVSTNDAAPNAATGQGRPARAKASAPPSSSPAQPLSQAVPTVPESQPAPPIFISHRVPAWREGLVIGMTGLAAALLLWILLLRPRRRERVQSVEQLKEDIVSNLTHELITPLTPITVYPRLLAEGRLRGKQVKHAAEQMMDASRRLERRIDALVTYATLRRGGFTPGTDAVDVARLAAEVAQNRGEGRTTVGVTALLPANRADERLLRVAIEELLDNALKFSPDGGPVEIVVGRSMGTNDSRVEISVADRGIGMDSADLAAAFEEFKQLDASSTRRFGGIGLGLTLANQIARLHGGEVRGSSTPGGGSTFVLSIPERVALSSVVPVHAA